MIDTVVDVIALAGGELEIERPGSPEPVLDEAAFLKDEFMPYWAELWPSALGLARAVAPRSLGGMRVLELGCGLALPGIAAARAGARVLVTDWSPDALEVAAMNARRNGVEIETMHMDWRKPQALLARAPFDLVLASDVLYEERNLAPLLGLLPRLGSEVLLADPGRSTAAPFFSAANEEWTLSSTADPGHASVRVHRMQRKPLVGAPA